MSDFVLYRFWNDEQLLYVGMSIRAYQRFAEHQATALFFTEATNITMQRFPDLRSLQVAEIEAIETENPQYNIARPRVEIANSAHCCSMHSELIGARAKEQHERNRASGLVWGVDAGLTSAVPAFVVSLILEMREAGFSLRQIASHLNAEHILAARGGQWQASQVSRVLKSPRTKRIAEMKL